ncbi:putative DNA primase/helicase [Actinokineospora baliensis]|uniref:phage/plasmid primase, P4 family n=1 Tax=Actinokineospora baliensis TaxID=547056 RepID=UPI00195E57A6|nr:phage/plasmid primase, P4 family [Actinokineospora baliensis]MBM7770885.1 putative DNA primase/helicase [Actinokineospora baliensis]
MERLGGTTGTAVAEKGGLLVPCPAHTDSNPSLFISLTADGRALVYCRAGCPTNRVLDVAFLSESDLFDVEGTPTAPSVASIELPPSAIAALAQYVRAAQARFDDSPSADYAMTRFGVNAELAHTLRLGHDDGSVSVGPAQDYRSRSYRSFPRLVVPALDAAGMPRGLQGRDLSGHCPGRWLNLASPEQGRWSAVGVFRTPDSYPTVVVSEGPGDGLAAAATGYTVVWVRGAGVARSPQTAREIANIADGADVIMAGDNDNAGAEFTRALGANLAALNITARVLRLPDGADDLTAWREADPARFVGAFHKAVGDAAPWQAGDRAAGARQSRKRLGPVHGTDIDHARRALEVVGRDTVHIEGVGFLYWTGRVWQPMVPSQERAIGHRVADALFNELASLPRGDKNGTREERQQAEDYVTAYRSVRRMHMDNGTRAALDNLRTFTTSQLDDFDSRHHLLTFRNGTVDLRTGKLREHRREDRLTRWVDLDYDPDATCPRWDRFLTEIFPGDDELPDFMARLIGYGITGESQEHIFGLLYGHGSNGKSVFTNTLSRVFAGITGHMSQAAIAYTRNFDSGAPNPALAALRGVRLGILSELSDGLRLNEPLMKQITAGDPVTARELYRNQFTFTPTALLLMATNFKPEIKGQDEGVWRRTRLIPFTREFGADKDPGLPAHLLTESQGIAAWAVRGATEWYRGGLREPESVMAAVREYRRSVDLLDGFLPGVLVRDESGEITLSDAFNAFQDWVESEQVEQVRRWGKIRFRQQLEGRKLRVTRRNKGVVILGARRARPDESD